MSNPDLLPSTPWSRILENDFWGTPLSDSGSHGSYRPLCVLTFRLNYLLGGFQPWGYHLVNVLLHCLATALLVRVARNVLPKSRSSVGPAVTGLIFATHPIHSEAVAGVVGRADLAACNFYLLSFLTYLIHIRCRDSTCCMKKQNCSWTIDCNVVNKEDEKQKQSKSLKYHKFVVNLQSNLTNCYWTRNLTRDISSSEMPVSIGKHLRKNADEFEISCCWKKKLKQWGSLSACLLLSVAAMLSKETGITVLGVCILFDLIHSSTITKVSNFVTLHNI